MISLMRFQPSMVKSSCQNTKKFFYSGMLIGGLAFCLLYGIKILDVTYVEWLHNKGDLSMHYNGWLFFRNSKWHFPIGLMDTILYPGKISILYTDSIPLFAILFKLLSPILPEKFQYFGIWGLLCFGFQGGIGAVILGRFVKSLPVCLMGTLFLFFSPWMIQRMYVHTALAAHWLILWAIYICLDIKKSVRYQVIIWSLLLSVTVMVQIYFIPMLEVILLSSMLYKSVKEKEVRWKVGCLLCVPNLMAILSLILLGAFSGTPDYNIGGLGEASANLNFWLNPIGKSRFIKDFALAAHIRWPEEGFGYLGAGGLLLLVIAVGIVSSMRGIVSWIEEHILEIAFALLACTILLMLALGPEIAINSHVLFTWHYLPWIENLLNVFRSLGRFVWPICYMILLSSIVTIGLITERRALLLLALCFCVQMVDLEGYYHDRFIFVREEKGYDGFSKEFPATALEGYDYCIVFDVNNWAEIGNFAAVNNLKLNDTYTARKNNSAINDYKDQIINELSNGVIRDRTLYIISSGIDISLFRNAILYEIKGTLFAVKTRLPGMDAYLYKK